jgi:three-Cys-motif partner protein
LGEEKAIWPLDPHTAAKHVLLRKYLNAWLPIITSFNGRVIYCDGFAGPGIYESGEDGSPIIALKAFLEHAHNPQMKAEIIYLFIEEDSKRCESLKGCIERLKIPANVKIGIINKTYEEAFTEVLDELADENKSMAPTFAFIDPFGIKGLPLRIISRLMRHRKCEVFITFMIGFLHRFVSTDEFAPHCDELFGTNEWRKALAMAGTEKEQFLRELYQRRLMDQNDGVAAKYTRYFTMKNDRNRPIYDLFFATNHPKGIDVMKDAMWNVDQSAGFSFSDATVPGQETLFTAEPDWDALMKLLATRFKGQLVSWNQVEEAIRNTPFRIRTTPLKQEAKKANGRFKIIQPAGRKANAALDYLTTFQFV